jgi:glyoxylase-like metal-dependent hydrolase (beta-lactamase superfamily II)
MMGVGIGDFRVDCVVDIERPFLEAQQFFPDLSDDMLAYGRCILPKGDIEPDGRLRMSFQSFVVKTSRHTILVDTCCGNDKDRLTRPEFHHLRTDYLAALATAGVRPEQVDFVLCTHLHWDHVGWNTRLLDGKWVPTFPNARYIIARNEFEHWNASFERGDKGIHLASFEDSVLPVMRAEQAVLVDSDYELDQGVWLEPCPGHSPGHVVINLASRGRHAIVSGDVIHHRIQLAYPELSTVADADMNLARTNRVALIERLADNDILLLPAHFPPPVIGRVVKRGQGYGYVAATG